MNYYEKAKKYGDFKEFFPVENADENANGIATLFHYDRPDYYKNIKPGFYVTVYPEKHEKGMYSFVAYTGKTFLIHECNRFSEKQKQIAIEKYRNLLPKMLQYIAAANGYKINYNGGNEQ